MRDSAFTSVKIVGGLLPADLLGRIREGDKELPGIGPQTYGLERGESVRRQAARSWAYLLEVWKEFAQEVTKRHTGQQDMSLTRVTREKWLHILLRELGFGKVPATPAGGIVVDGTNFAVSHYHDHVPIHLLGWGTDLDHRTKRVAGAARRPPQSMVQELLNRSDDHLWAILSNGATLRLLRDSTALVGSAYIEFDLEAIFGGDLFSDFVLLYLLCHETRFRPNDEEASPATSWLEQWREHAVEAGTRALDQLRNGVEQAIGRLGTGFLAGKDNSRLRRRLHPVTGDLRIEDFNRSLLRVVYRLLFWFVAEARSALLNPAADPTAKQRYTTYYSAARLQRLARKRHGDRHRDLWEAVQVVFRALGTEGGQPLLALPGIGGIYEYEDDDGSPLSFDEPLDTAHLSNEALLAAVRALTIVRTKDGGGLRPVDFGNLGAEELGSVYESLLELIPRFDPDDRTYSLTTLPGNERKATGSYYTPTALVECLLDSTLDPLLTDAAAKPTQRERIAALERITVCDPACGSGHFLVAAARRIAKRVAAEETGDPEPPDAVVRSALRRIIGRCIYGVDADPMAVELTKLALWMEGLTPGKVLNFLDANIRIGNSLLGITPRLFHDGIPDAAFSPLEGDDRKVVASLRKENQIGRLGYQQLPAPIGHSPLSALSAEITSLLPDEFKDMRAVRRRWNEEFQKSAEQRDKKLYCDAWCTAFVQAKIKDSRDIAVTNGLLTRLIEEPESINDDRVASQVRHVDRQFRFFHWHLEFPHIFGGDGHNVDPHTGWSVGFSCVIGNPPWERVKLQEQEFFATRRAEIANATNAAERKTLIRQLIASNDPADGALHLEFQKELYKAAALSHFLRNSGRYPLTGRGDVNTYAVFAETARAITAPLGRFGIIVPTGIATDATTAPFFRDLVEQQRLDSLLDFVTNPQLWTDVGNRRYRFSILVACGRGAHVEEAEFATLIKHPAQLPPRGKRIRVSGLDLLLVNPNTGTCPMFKSQRDADITLDIYRRVPVLWQERPESSPWRISFFRMFDMANDSGLFQTRDELQRDGWSLHGNIFSVDGRRALPLYEPKLVHHFDHRLACYSKRAEGSQDTELPRLDSDEKDDPSRVPIPRYWVQETEADKRLAGRWRAKWLLGWRDVTNATNERTLIVATVPHVATNHKFILIFGDRVHLLCGCLSSFVVDFAARQKVSGASMSNFSVKQLPVLSPTTYDGQAPWAPGHTLAHWTSARLLELIYTAYDIRHFALDLGDDGEPFRWDENRRALLRAELDAAYFHLYGIRRDDVEYIMDTFPIVKRKDEERHGEYRTKRLILEIYEEMAEAIRNGGPYRTILDPPPGQGPRHGVRVAA